MQPKRNVVHRTDSSSPPTQFATTEISLATSNGDGVKKNETRPKMTLKVESTKRRHHSVLMDTSVRNFQRLLNDAREHMRLEVENLPLRVAS